MGYRNTLVEIKFSRKTCVVYSVELDKLVSKICSLKLKTACWSCEAHAKVKKLVRTFSKGKVSLTWNFNLIEFIVNKYCGWLNRTNYPCGATHKSFFDRKVIYLKNPKNLAQENKQPRKFLWFIIDLFITKNRFSINCL